MVNSVFFCMSFLLLLFGLVFIYKVPKEVSLLCSVVICFITELCIGSVIAGIFSLFEVPICIINMGIAYLVLGIGEWLLIVKQRKIQKVIMRKLDIYSFAVIFIAFLFIFFKIFTPDISNVYVNSDPVTHYSFALRVLDNGSISRMYFAELYNGLILEIFQPLVSRVDLYKAFIIADSLAQLVNIFMFYVLSTTVLKSRVGMLAAPVLSIFYFMGWPFYSYVLGGFVYYGWGVTLFAYTIYLLVKLHQSENRINKMILCCLVLLGIFGTLVCYMLFVPALILVVICSLVIIKKEQHIELSKQVKAGIVGVALLGGGIIAAVGFLGYFHGDLSYFWRALRQDGWIHKDLYRDFVVLMPASFYMCWYYYRTKKSNMICVSVSVVFSYIVLSFPMCSVGIMSPYYYYKPYFLLWLLAWVMCLDAMEHFWKRDRAIVIIYGIMLLFPMTMTLSGTDAKMQEKGIEYDEKGNAHYPSLMPILQRNEFFLSGEDHDIRDREALSEVCEYINKDILFDEENIPLIVNDEVTGMWYQNFTGKEYTAAMDADGLEKAISHFEEMGYNYFVLHQNVQLYRENIHLFEGLKTLYNNGYYGIYSF